MITPQDYVKKYTSVPSDFIDDYFAFINESTTSTEPVIDLDIVCKWLNVYKYQIMQTLRKSYKKGIDYTIEKARHPTGVKYANNYKRVLISADALKNLCMLSQAKNAQAVRDYFIEIENTFIKYRNEINKALTDDLMRMRNNQKPLPSGGTGWIYVIKASEKMDSVYKIGRTKDLKRRMREHSSSQMDDVEIVYQYKVDDVEAVETCMKGWLKPFKYRKYKEVYQVDVDIIRQVTTKCNEVGAIKAFAMRRKPKMMGGYYIVAIKE